MIYRACPTFFRADLIDLIVCNRVALLCVTIAYRCHFKRLDRGIDSVERFFVKHEIGFPFPFFISPCIAVTIVDIRVDCQRTFDMTCNGGFVSTNKMYVEFTSSSRPLQVTWHISPPVDIYNIF